MRLRKIIEEPHFPDRVAPARAALTALDADITRFDRLEEEEVRPPVTLGNVIDLLPLVAVHRHIDFILLGKGRLPVDLQPGDDPRLLEPDLPPFRVAKIAAPARVHLPVDRELGIVVAAAGRGRRLRLRRLARVELHVDDRETPLRRAQLALDAQAPRLAPRERNLFASALTVGLRGDLDPLVRAVQNEDAILLRIRRFPTDDHFAEHMLFAKLDFPPLGVRKAAAPTRIGQSVDRQVGGKPLLRRRSRRQPSTRVAEEHSLLRSDRLNLGRNRRDLRLNLGGSNRFLLPLATALKYQSNQKNSYDTSHGYNLQVIGL